MVTKQITPTNNKGSSNTGLIVGGLAVVAGGGLIWAATIRLPDCPERLLQ
jgi:hypothetical protein